MPDPPLTPAQRAYLATFDAYLANPTRDSERRREFTLAVMLFEADVHPEQADPYDIELSDAHRGNRDIGGS